MPPDPDPMNEPGYEAYDSLNELFSDLGAMFIEAAQKLGEAFKQAHLSTPRQGSKVIIGQSMASALTDEHGMTQEQLDAYAHVVKDAAKLVRPLLEATQGHYAVCDHKPRCKKPPEHARFSRSAQNSRRPRELGR